jgi:hypothetical protein
MTLETTTQTTPTTTSPEGGDSVKGPKKLEMDFWRQTDIVPSTINEIEVTVIGAGGIGSPTTLALSKMGVQKINVYDDDTVENHNLPNQMYRFSDLYKHKVHGLFEICKDFTGIEINPIPERLKDQRLTGVVISGVDSMESRKIIWDQVKYRPAINLYIDARMGAEVARIHTVKPCDPDSIKWYETTLYDDKESSEEPCTARAVIYNVFTISSLVANQVKKFSKGEPFPKEIIVDLHNYLLLTQ